MSQAVAAVWSQPTAAPSQGEGKVCWHVDLTVTLLLKVIWDSFDCCFHSSSAAGTTKGTGRQEAYDVARLVFLSAVVVS
ncbi:hypothetical protein E2C01_099794 [Portunus trituberculatus]|uniref:Uncharacterized protein n=1 Tax=Portunus trituberculatus TaxID=210409 RepID=A0A5B7K194_PORTR|nr:hypothetical protein [Portunus trituberculatus]